MKKILVAAIIFSLLFNMIGCSFFNSLFSLPETYVPNVCAYYLCPIFTNPDLKGSPYTILEKDDFGRILFRKGIYIYSDYLVFYFILQKKDNRAVYFYENGFMLYTGNETDIDSFKSENDWNLPIDKEKLSSRSPRISFDSFIKDPIDPDSEKIINDISKLYNIEENNLVYHGFADHKEDNILLWFTINCDSGQREIFAIVSNDIIIATFETDSSFSNINQISDFKLENGW